jgi:hypothetical protein
MKPIYEYITFLHDILICKLSAYGLSDNATKLMLSYLSNRKQQLKIENIVSTWANIQKGVSQDSIFGPLLYQKTFYQLQSLGIFLDLLACN